MKRAVVIVAGGSGKRMGSSVPKQFLIAGGRPVLMHTIERFYGYDREMQIVVVLPAEHHEYWRGLCEEHSFGVRHQVVAGGKERFFSVKNGLEAVDEGVEVVGVHDGVRPLVSAETIEACFAAAALHGCAVPTTAPVESLRHINKDGSSQAVVRSEYLSVQTPQCFRHQILSEAYRQEFSARFTDDASVVESAGYGITTVAGNAENIKITTPTDLRLAEILLGRDAGNAELACSCFQIFA